MKKRSIEFALLTAIQVLFAALALAFLAGCPTETDDNKEPLAPVPPVLGDGRAEAAVGSGTGAILFFRSDTAGTWYYLVLDDGAAEPDAGALKASANQGAAAAGLNTVTVTGLSKGAFYKAYIAVETAGALFSEILVIRFSPVDFVITGSAWYLGRDKLVFQANGKVLTHGKEYDYTYDPADRTGSIGGDLSDIDHRAEGIAPGDVINPLGPYMVAEDAMSLIFSNYRNSDFAITFSRTPDSAGADNLLVGTAWSWGAGTGTGLTLEFLPNERVLQYSFYGYYPHPHIYPYTYDRAAKKGNIQMALRVCGYSGALTPLGPFEILSRDNITRVYFANYKSYGHDGDYHKRPEG
ncbi:MAG: hypothetical protein LBQ88_07730 [Treponema sp.]|nr:hypothetical protein [Treponema sp.]